MNANTAGVSEPIWDSRNSDEPLTIETAAQALYESYCVALGGTMPPWNEFRHDPRKTRYTAGWIAVAQTHARIRNIRLIE